MKPWLPVVLTTIGAASAALAQPPSEPVPADTATVHLPGVVVTALRGRDRLHEIPASSFVFTRERIVEHGATRLSTLLRTLPGLHGYQHTSNGDVRVVDPRGFTANGESSYLKVLVDGQDVRDVENGNVDWDWLLPHDVERVEVVEGPGAWLYGDGAEGGIVNVVRPGPREGLHSECGLQAGSFGHVAGSLALSARGAGLAGTLRGSTRRVDGFRDRSRERVVGGGGSASWSAGPRTRLSLDASWLDADREDPGTLTPERLAADRTQADTPTDFEHPRRAMLGLHLGHGEPGASEWRLAPYLRGEDTDRVRTLLYQTKAQSTRALTAGAEAGWRRAFALAGRPASVAIELQGERSELRSTYYDFEGGGRGALATDVESERATVAGFAGGRLALDDRTTARLGFRQDVVRVRAEDRRTGQRTARRTFSLSSPFAAVSREVLPGVGLYASASAAFRIPTLNQLFDRRPYFNPFTFEDVYLSNPDLAAQKSHGAEIGARRDGADGAWGTLAVYSIWVRDEIDFDAGTNTYANLSRSWHRGVQGAWSQPLGGGVTATASGTWSPTTIRGGEHDGNQINGVPLGTVYGSLRWAGAGWWALEGAVRHVAHQYLEKANQHRLPDVTTVEAAASLAWSRIRATLRVHNLLDREYVDTGYYVDLGPLLQERRLQPAPGRSLTLAVTFD